MQPDDDQPMVHEIGNRTYIVAPVDPLDLDGVRTMQVGTAIWAIALVLLLPFYSRLDEADKLWWLWTCLAGFGLGLVGWDHCRRRRNARQEAAAPSADASADPSAGPSAGPSSGPLSGPLSG